MRRLVRALPPNRLHDFLVAVLGCGLDRTYPPEHQALRKQIEAGGAVIAELPLGSYPHGYHFPRRNRIISGMSLVSS